jgi:uncharacterized membrane protein YhdT
MSGNRAKRICLMMVWIACLAAVLLDRIFGTADIPIWGTAISCIAFGFLMYDEVRNLINGT